MKKSEHQKTLDNMVSEIPRLRRFARYLAKDSNYADDLVQDCLVRAVEKIHTWQEGTNLRAWLFVILKNVFLNNLRISKREIITDFSEENEIPLTAPAAQESSIALKELNRQFQKLSHDHQEILFLIAVEGFKYDEAAEILKLPIGTIRSRLARARQALVNLSDEQDSLDEKNQEQAFRVPVPALKPHTSTLSMPPQPEPKVKKRGVRFQ